MNPRRSDSATILLDGWVWCVVTNHQLEILRTPQRICFLATRFIVFSGLIMHGWFWHVLQIWHSVETRDFLLLVVFDIHRCLWNVWRCMMNPRRSDSATILLDGWVWCVVTNHQLEILRTPQRICFLATRFIVFSGLIMHGWFWHVLQIWHSVETRDFLLLVVIDVHGCLWNVWRCMMNPRRSDSATILFDGWVWCVVTNHQLEILRCLLF